MISFWIKITQIDSMTVAKTLCGKKRKLLREKVTLKKYMNLANFRIDLMESMGSTIQYVTIFSFLIRWIPMKIAVTE